MKSLSPLAGRVLLLLIPVCLWVALASGCSTVRTKSHAQAPPSSAAVSAPRIEPPWQDLLSSGRVSIAGAGSVTELGYSEPVMSAASDPRLLDSARNALKLRVAELAESEIARAALEMQENSASRLNARRHELQESCDRELVACKVQGASDCAAKIREIAVSNRDALMNLRLKIVTAKARKAMFGEGSGPEAEKRLVALNAQLAELDKRCAQSVQSARDAEAQEAVSLRKRLADSQDAELNKLRKSLEDQNARDIKARRDRLAADLADGVSQRDWNAPARVGEVSGAGLGVAVSETSRVAELDFEQSLQAARAAALARRNRIMERNSRDAATVRKSLAKRSV